jgi:hypothetical protein
MSTSNRPIPAAFVAVVVLVLVGAAAMAGAVPSVPGFSLGTGTALSSGGTAGTLVIDDVDAPSRIWTDDDLSVTVVVNNTGDQQATRDVRFLVDSDGDGSREVAGVQSVTVDAGATESVTFSLPTGEDGLAAGTHTYQVDTADDQFDGSLTFSVLRPAHVSVLETVPQDPVVAGDPGTMTVEVENHGDFRAGRVLALAVDIDGDGTFATDEQVSNGSVNVDPRTTDTTSLALPTDRLLPGTYDYRVSVRDESVTGELTVVAPAKFELSNLSAPADVVRGDRMTVSAVVTNTGDVAGTKTVRLDTNATGFERVVSTSNASDTLTGATVNETGETDTANETDALTETVTLDSGESTTVGFEVATGNVTGGTYAVGVASPDHTVTDRLRVRQPFFKVAKLVTPEIDDIGDRYTFVGVVHNKGDASGTQVVDLRIDVDDDNKPESVGINRTVTVAPGETVHVELEMQTGHVYPHDTPVENLDEGTYIYGFFTDDHNRTSTVTFRDSSSRSDSSDGGSSDSDENAFEVTKDEISQTKYGLYYVELSEQTSIQVDEIDRRQPFADGFTMADVETREEIARRLGYYDGDAYFIFHEEITVEQQQTVEQQFDAQFQSETGDRIESWEELAQAEYDTSYDSLNETQQSDIRDQYDDQF